MPDKPAQEPTPARPRDDQGDRDPIAAFKARADFRQFCDWAEKQDVSRETIGRLARFTALLLKWQQRINLISGKTAESVWVRHILDSAQLVVHLPRPPGRILDLGSGAGLPGVILSIMTDHELHLAEADSRKIAFLRVALRETGSQAVLHEGRIEELPDLQPDIITARAFAPLDRLLSISRTQHHRDLVFWLHKGREVNSELTGAASWTTLKAEVFDSITASDGHILKLSGHDRKSR